MFSMSKANSANDKGNSPAGNKETPMQLPDRPRQEAPQGRPGREAPACRAGPGGEEGRRSEEAPGRPSGPVERQAGSPGIIGFRFFPASAMFRIGREVDLICGSTGGIRTLLAADARRPQMAAADHRLRGRGRARRDGLDPALRTTHGPRPEGRFALRVLGAGRQPWPGVAVIGADPLGYLGNSLAVWTAERFSSCACARVSSGTSRTCRPLFPEAPPGLRPGRTAHR